MLVFTVLAVVVMDQATKAVVAYLIGQGGVVEVVPGVLNIVHYRNPGAAFGIFREGGTVHHIVLSSISIIAAVVLGFLVLRARDRWSALALSLIAGGAAGNLIDRLRTGEVVDFVDLHVGRYHWPAFNVADTAITTGVAVVLFLLYIRER